MPTKSFLTPGALTLVLALACSCSGKNDAKGTSGNQESSTSGGSAGSAGASTIATTTNGSTTSGGAGGAVGAVTSGASVGGMAGGPGDDLSFVPEDLPVSKLDGGGETINLTALTLLQRAAGPELFLAVRNDGEDTACDPNISVEFLDQDERSLATWVGTLYIEQLFLRSDDPNTILSCLEPGKVALAGSQDLPEGIVVDELGMLVYHFSYFAADILPFDIIPTDALTVSEVESYQTVSGSVFGGTLENGLDVALVNPTVTIFPLNGVGRPLAMATGSEMIEVAPGTTWTFQTSTVYDLGVGQAVYPRGTLGP